MFSDKSGREMAETIIELQKLGMKKLIFDLRDNPGGLLSRAVDVADIFLEPGETIVSTRGRISSSNQVFKARRSPLWNGGAVVTMISGGSASASEIVSGALQDHDKAIIMGISSYDDFYAMIVRGTAFKVPRLTPVPVRMPNLRPTYVMY